MTEETESYVETAPPPPRQTGPKSKRIQTFTNIQEILQSNHAGSIQGFGYFIF